MLHEIPDLPGTCAGGAIVDLPQCDHVATRPGALHADRAAAREMDELLQQW